MAVSYSLSPNASSINGGSLNQTIPVSFTVYRAGDTSVASSINWYVMDNPSVPNDVEKNFFVAGTATSGSLMFGAGQTSKVITLGLKGGINVLPGGFDWGTFDLGVNLNASSQATAGFNQSASGGYGVTINDYLINAPGGTLNFNYNMYSIPDQVDIYRNGQLILSTNQPVSDTGTLTYNGGANPLQVGEDIKVIMIGAIQGTAWDYNINYNPGISTLVSAHTLVDTGAPSVTELARLSAQAYAAPPAKLVNGYKLLATTPVDPSFAGFGAQAYSNENGTQIVVAFRGTVPDQSLATLKNVLSDTSFLSGIATPTMKREIQDAVAFVNQVRNTYGSSATITLTGHSLGGAIAQVIGRAGQFATTAFDAPGAGALYNQFTAQLQGLTAHGSSSVSNNYRLRGDQVSLAGMSIGSQYTVNSPYSGSLSRAGDNHSIDAMVKQLHSGAGIVAGVPDMGINYAAALAGALLPAQVTAAAQIGFLGFSFVTDALVNRVLDPVAGSNFVFKLAPNSPMLNSAVLPSADNVYTYRVDTQVNGVWGNTTYVAPDVQIAFGNNVTGMKFVPLDSSAQVVRIPSSFLMQQSFKAGGSVNATLMFENGDQSNIRDFDRNGASDILLRNSSGSVIDWLMQNGGYLGYREIGNTNGYSVAGTGDFNGDGTTDILLRGANGDVFDWSVNGGVHSGTTYIGNAQSYSVVGTGDFNGDGTTDVLLKNLAGNVIDWAIQNGTNLQGYKQVGTVADYGILGVGDYDGDGTADVLLQNGQGSVINWIMGNGSYQKYNAVGFVSDYGVVGQGDFNGDGTSDVLLENGNGDVIAWLMRNGQYDSYTRVGNAAGFGVVGTGDYDGNGTSDILLQSGSRIIEWSMQNGNFAGWRDVGNAGGYSVVPT